MKKLKPILTIIISILFCSISNAQQFCDQVSLLLNSSQNVDFTFDSFGKYLGGVTENGVSQLRVTVSNSLTNNPDCRWNLVIYVDNSSNPSTPTDEWELLVPHTSTGSVPKIDQLQIRVRNRCSTPITGSGFFYANVLPGQPIILISNTGITIPAGSCTPNVNGPGNYIKNYDEFSFDIDYRIAPGLNLKSGIYQLRLKYFLTEAL